MVVTGFGPPREYGTVPGGVAAAASAARIFSLARASLLLGPVTSELGNVALAGPNPAGIGLYGPTCWIFPGPEAAFPAGPDEPAWPKAVCAPPSQPTTASATPILAKLHIGE
jgi:hypothetical protein